jgi:hypothetical protein
LERSIKSPGIVKEDPGGTRRNVVRFGDPSLRREEDSEDGPDGEERLLPGKEDKKGGRIIREKKGLAPGEDAIRRPQKA